MVSKYRGDCQCLLVKRIEDPEHAAGVAALHLLTRRDPASESHFGRVLINPTSYRGRFHRRYETIADCISLLHTHQIRSIAWCSYSRLASIRFARASISAASVSRLVFRSRAA